MSTEALIVVALVCLLLMGLCAYLLATWAAEQVRGPPPPPDDPSSWCC